MELVTVKTKYQVTIPRKLREELGIDTGDLLEAEVQDGKIVLTPKEVIDRDAAFARMEEIGKEAREAVGGGWSNRRRYRAPDSRRGQRCALRGIFELSKTCAGRSRRECIR